VPRDDAATTLLPRPRTGRTFTTNRRVRLSDTTTGGALRLDALARYIQDVASDDARETMTASYLAWVVRRTLLVIDQPPRSEEECELTTWCSGYGGRWAERRTSIVGADGGRCESAVLWVATDPETAAPSRLPDEFHAAYDEAAAGRRVTARLQHADPPSTAARIDWRFRAADLDRLGHVNNAAFWVAVEEHLAATARRSSLRAELEYREPVPPGAALQLVGDAGAGWLVDDTGAVKASFRTSDPSAG
jgi:acyl-ACP thioesterase